MLKHGKLVRYEDRVWRVGLVNPSRARLDPVSGHVVCSPVNGRSFQSYGGSINIGANSMIDEVSEDLLTPGELAQVFRLIEQENQMAVAAAPGAEAKGQTLKEKNAERIAKLKAAKEAKAAEKAAEPKKEKVAKTPNKCKCGCGGDTGGFFIPGHDARFKSWLLKIERGQAKPEELLTPEVRASYTWKKSGKGLIPTKTYKGEPHSGYDTSTSEA